MVVSNARLNIGLKQTPVKNTDKFNLPGLKQMNTVLLLEIRHSCCDVRYRKPSSTSYKQQKLTVVYEAQADMGLNSRLMKKDDSENIQDKKRIGCQFSSLRYLLVTVSINASLRAAAATVCSTVKIPTVTAASIALRY
jgi:hypothetical protein